MRRYVLILVLGLVMGTVVATSVSTPTPADAANGDPAVLGTKNTSLSSTKFQGRNSTQFVNTKAGRPAIRLIVKPGAPPMAVNSVTVVDNFNADLLDGKSASDLKALSATCATVDALNGTDYACTTGIFVPAGGVLMMSGSIEIFNGSSETNDMVWCRFEVDDVLIQHTNRDMDVGFEISDDHAVCATDGSIVLTAGSHSVKFTLEGVAATTILGSASMNAIFIPH